MLKRSKTAILLTMALVISMFSGMFTTNLSAGEVHGVPFTPINEENDFWKWWAAIYDKQFKVNYNDDKNVTFDLNKDLAEFNEEKLEIYLKKPADWDGDAVVNDIGTITFENVGSIGDRNVNVIINLKSIHIYSEDKPKKFPESGKAIIGFFRKASGGDYDKDKDLWIGGYPLNKPNDDVSDEEWGNVYYGKQSTVVETKIVYQDNGAPVDFNITHFAKDLDNGNEGFKTVRGYTGKYYYFKDGDSKFPGANWTLKDIDGQIEVLSAPGNLTDVYPEHVVGGIYLETTGGEFSTNFQTENSGIGYHIYCQYLNISDTPNPYKAIEDDKTYGKGDMVTFDVAHTLFIWNDTFTKYSSMCLYDEIPEGLEYDSAEAFIVTKGNDNQIIMENITENGKLSYDKNKKTVSFNVPSEWLNDEDNYLGQDIVLKIKAKVDGAVPGEISNTGHLLLNNSLDLLTNTVKITVDKPSLCGRIWEDKNKNGIRDDGENGIPGITVNLIKDGVQVGESVVTNSAGFYNFYKLDAGTYTVEANVDYNAYDLTAKNAEGNPDLDSDAEKENGKAIIKDIEIGSDEVKRDVGLIKKPSGGVIIVTQTSETIPEPTPVTTTAAFTEETTVTDVTVTEGTEATTVTAPSDTEATAATSGENSPATGNAPIAMASVPVALTAAAVAISLTRRKKSR